MDITAGLRRFNNWLEPFLIELSMLLLIIGFTTGSIDLLTGGAIARIPTFEYAWASIQAIAIDGLFFSVWFQVRRTEWTTTRQIVRSIALILIGCVLGFVAALVNDVLSLQQVQNIASSVAMAQLHIDPVAFTHTRAGLVVAVAIMMALVREQQPIAQPALASTIKAEDLDQALKALAEVASLREQLAQLQAVKVAEVQAPVNPLQQITEHSETLNDDQVEESVNTGVQPIKGLQFESFEPRITSLYRDNPGISPAEVEQLVGCSRVTAIKWLNRLQAQQ